MRPGSARSDRAERPSPRERRRGCKRARSLHQRHNKRAAQQHQPRTCCGACTRAQRGPTRACARLGAGIAALARLQRRRRNALHRVVDRRRRNGPVACRCTWRGAGQRGGSARARDPGRSALSVRRRWLLRAADVRRTCRRRKPGEGSTPRRRCAPRCRELSPQLLLCLNSRLCRAEAPTKASRAACGV